MSTHDVIRHADEEIPLQYGTRFKRFERYLRRLGFYEPQHTHAARRIEAVDAARRQVSRVRTYADSADSTVPCFDEGPWPCTEAGCPQSTVACHDLRSACALTVGDVWDVPPMPRGLKVWAACPQVCFACERGHPELYLARYFSASGDETTVDRVSVTANQVLLKRNRGGVYL